MTVPRVIESGARFEGLLCFESSARVEGELVGSVLGDGLLEIGRGARVEGSIDVAVLRVEGEIDGEVRVLKKMVVGPGAQIRGTIATAALEVSDGASIEGPVRMTRPDPS